jgi:hypothetical protein
MGRNLHSSLFPPLAKSPLVFFLTNQWRLFLFEGTKQEGGMSISRTPKVGIEPDVFLYFEGMEIIPLILAIAARRAKQP